MTAEKRETLATSPSTQKVELVLRITDGKGKVTEFSPTHKATVGATIDFEMSQNAGVEPIYEDDEDDPVGFERSHVETVIRIRTTFDPPQRLHSDVGTLDPDNGGHDAADRE